MRLKFSTLAMLAIYGVIGTWITIWIVSDIRRTRFLRAKLATKNTVNQITVALNAYHAEYGVWPVSSLNESLQKSQWFGEMKAGASACNNALFFTLRGIPKGPNEGYKANSSRVIFFEGRTASFGKGFPSDGFYDRGPNGASPSPELEASFFDPWGHQYGIVIDTNGDGRLDLTGIYSDFTGDNAPRKQVGVFSFGKDGMVGTKGDGLYRSGAEVSDDVISWE